MAFAIGLIAFGIAWWLLVGLKRKDVADCRAVLGLEPVARVTARGTSPEGLTYSQTSILGGTLAGRPATLFERSAGHPAIPTRRRRGAQFTVLELTLPRPAAVSIRLQPTGMLGSIEALVQGEVPRATPIDPAFDAAYTVYADDAASAVILLTPALRERVLAFRARVSSDLPTSAPGRLASGLVLGTFDIDGAVARYVLFGSPTRSTAEQVKAAAPILVDLAARAGGS